MFNAGFEPLRRWPRFPSEVPPDVDWSSPGAEAAPPAWWERPAEFDAGLGGGSEPHWPWLRTSAGDVPGFRLNPDGSVRTDEQGSDVRLMSGALAPFQPQGQPNDVAGDGVTFSDVPPSPPSGMAPFPVAASSLVLPGSAGGAVGTLDLGKLAARVVPAAAGAGSAAVAALPFMFIPTNTQSETTDLEDGLRARVRPGQRSVEIERRVHNGLFGTGILPSWETLPVEAWRQVRRDGSVDTVINHEQLNRALGRNAAAEPNDAGISAMARPPKDGEPQQRPPTNSGSSAEEADKPDTGSPPAAHSLAPSRIDAMALEEAKQRDPEEERVLACRAVRKMPGQPAPSGQYDGPEGIETAVGIRVAPGFPAPGGGYDYRSDYLRHFNGYKGELELKNRIEKAIPYEKIVHYGNPAGVHGPDVMTIGPPPRGRIMEWNSRSRQAPRRVTRAGIPSVKYADAHEHVSGAIASGALSDYVGRVALDELSDGNYDVCTVGTGNAYGGYFEAVRNNTPTGPRE